MPEFDRSSYLDAEGKKRGLDKAGFFVRANAAAPGVTPHMRWHVLGPGVDPPRIRP
ncbi:MAG TPA: hypothetical protein VI056_15635 [Candidatus Limnocylindria bacterium]